MNRVLTEFIPARQVSLTDRVHDQILELIIKNATEEEMVLTEKKLMELLGVSKAPVREALIKLCSEDVLINVPRFGYRVVRMTEKDARDAKQMRMLLETEAKSKMEIFQWIWYAVTKTVQVEPVGGLPYKNLEG